MYLNMLITYSMSKNQDLKMLELFDQTKFKIFTQRITCSSSQCWDF